MNLLNKISIIRSVFRNKSLINLNNIIDCKESPTFAKSQVSLFIYYLLIYNYMIFVYIL